MYSAWQTYHRMGFYRQLTLAIPEGQTRNLCELSLSLKSYFIKNYAHDCVHMSHLQSLKKKSLSSTGYELVRKTLPSVSLFCWLPLWHWYLTKVIKAGLKIWSSVVFINTQGWKKSHVHSVWERVNIIALMVLKCVSFPKQVPYIKLTKSTLCLMLLT